MAGKKKNPGRPAPKKRRKGLLCAVLIAALAVGSFGGWMYLQARITHLRRAEIYLPDLPAQMDGLEILYLSDFNIRNRADGRSCARLMRQIGQTEPDVLVLGGDYTAPGLLDALNDSDGNAQQEAADFIRSLADFPAKLGKFAVTGENDAGNLLLEEAFRDAGITYLNDGGASIEKNGGTLRFAGVSDVSLEKTPYNQIGRHYSAGDCVIAIAHNPSAYVDIRVNEAKGGGAWADLVLSGHTLGGQIRLLGRTLREYTPEEARCMGGWYYIDDLPMLVSQGVGCEAVMLRLGTQSEAWLLTLRRTQPLELPDF